MTEAEAIRLVGGLMAAYRQSNQVTEQTFDAYVEDIQDLPYEPAALAIKRLRQTAKWLPAISEIRAAAAQLVSPLPEPDEAWAEVQQQMRKVGWCGKPTWSHPAIAETVTSMGWRELCQATAPGVDRSQFQRMYSARRQRTLERESVSADVRELTDTLAASLASPTAAPREVTAR